MTDQRKFENAILEFLNRMNYEYGDDCYFPISTIAKETKISESTIRRKIKHLIGEGLVDSFFG